MQVAEASDADVGSFLALAAEVEAWFGPMVHDARFHDAVRRNIARRSALVAVDVGGAIVGGLLFSHHHAPEYEIGWIVVSESSRSRGVGEALLAEAFRRWVRPACVVSVVTFGSDHPGARSRRFYERLGFEAADLLDPGPEGGSRQLFRLELDVLPPWVG